MSKLEELQKLVQERGGRTRSEGTVATGVLKSLLETIAEQEERIQILEAATGVGKQAGPRLGDELEQICSCTGCEYNLVFGRHGPYCPCCEYGSMSGCGAEQYDKHCVSCKCEKCKPHLVNTPATFNPLNPVGEPS